MKIQLPLETWMAVMDWILRQELATKVGKLWDSQLTPIAQYWLYEWRKNVQIGQLIIGKNSENRAAELRNIQIKRAHWQSIRGELLPMAEVDMPSNAVSFKAIVLSYLDPIAMALLLKMRPLFCNFHLIFAVECSYETSENYVFAKRALDHLMPLVSGPLESVETDKCVLMLMHEKYQAILLSAKIIHLSAQFVNDCIPAVANWLFTPRQDGLYRKFFTHSDKHPQDNYNFVAKRFMDSTRQTPSPFLILIRHFDVEPAEVAPIENGRTGEQLIQIGIEKRKMLENNELHISRYILIICCPLHVDQQWLDEKKQEMLKWDQFEVTERMLYIGYGKGGFEVDEKFQ